MFKLALKATCILLIPSKINVPPLIVQKKIKLHVLGKSLPYFKSIYNPNCPN